MGVDVGGSVPASAPTISAIGDDLAQHMEPVVRALRSDPNDRLSTKEELRFGTNGSLSINVRNGTWFSFEDGVGGGVLDFIARQIGGDRSDAAEWLEDFLGKPEVPIINIPKPEVNKPSRIVARYDYRDENGDLLFRVCRFEPKKFLQQAPDGTWSVRGIRQVPYRLPELLSRAPGTPVYVVEGEKDADRLAALGYVATCNAGGAGKWPEGLTEHFADADVRIIADNDEPGRKHTKMVCAALYAMARGVRIIELPDLPPKGDVSDWLDAGGCNLDEIADATPLWKPDALSEPQPKAETGGLRRKSGLPAPLSQDAYFGILGEIVQAIKPHTEADPAALLISALVMASTIVGRGPSFEINKEEGEYKKLSYCNLFCCLVGDTAEGRKGTAISDIESIFEIAAPVFFPTNVATGLSSGEGLIHVVRDATLPDDVGVLDKRLLIVEEEFGVAFRRMVIPGNSLSGMMRSAWDGRDLRTLTKNSPVKATKPHFGILGCITPHELQKELSATDLHNGFANRMLWISVTRWQLLPRGGGSIGRSALAEKLKTALLAASEEITYNFSDDAFSLYETYYSRLSYDTFHPTLKAILNREAPQVRRIAVLFAALDGATGTVEFEHVKAAISIVEYARRSALAIFSKKAKHPLADDVEDVLQAVADKGATRSEISKHFHYRKPASDYGDALDCLRERGLARCEIIKTPGRPANRWFIVK